MFNDSTNKYVKQLPKFEGVILPFYKDEISVKESELIKSKVTISTSIICELGSGSGGHLVELAKQNPESLILGFELRYKRIYRTAEKAALQNLTNILLFRTQAQRLFEFCSKKTVDMFYVNFPDPWQKQRWKKHRLLSEEFLNKILLTLKDGGKFSFKSDHKDYFAEVAEVIKRNYFFKIEKLTEDLHKSPWAEESITTEFEKLYKSKRLPTYFLEAIKIGDPIL
ncbi:MAG: tRNA (guanosine(46)-N7)-methyltransferase TrmB [bacterium]|nr:tRNA (guanosine(46)-N7)-methyltransferase TrmB [bacterium]